MTPADLAVARRHPMVRHLNFIEGQLKAKGIAVVRTPYLPRLFPKQERIKSVRGMFYTSLYYNNVVFDAWKGPDGKVRRSVILPIYGIKKLDGLAAKIYRDAGYEIKPFFSLEQAHRGAGPHCLTQVLYSPIQSGLEERIPLPSGVIMNKVIFITPEMASPQLFESLKTFKPVPGEQLPLVVFAEHAFHAEDIEDWLSRAGLAALEIVNVQKEIEHQITRHPDWNLFDVVAAKQVEYYLGTGTDIHTIWFFEDLKNLGRFLGVAPIHIQFWEKSLERQYGTQA